MKNVILDKFLVLLRVALLLGALSGFGLHLYLLISRHLSIPLSTSIDQVGAKFVFPNIMLCSNIPISGTTLKSFGKTIDKYVTNTLSKTEWLPKYFPEALGSKSKNVAMDENNIMTMFYSSVNRSLFADSLGHRKITTLLECRLDGNDCSNDTTFEDVYHDHNLKCIRMIPKKTGFRKLEVTLLAESLISNTQQKFVGIPLSQMRFSGQLEKDSKSGMLVYIYANNTKPHEYFMVGTGAETLIRVFQTDQQLYHKRKQLCQPQTLLDYTNFVDGSFESFQYTIQDCFRKRYVDTMAEECKCLPTMDTAREWNNKLPYCFDINNVTINSEEEQQFLGRLECFKRVDSDAVNIVDLDGCTPACQSRTYSSQVSSVRWPISYAALDAMKKYIDILKTREKSENLDYFSRQYFEQQAYSHIVAYYAMLGDPSNALKSATAATTGSWFRDVIKDNMLKLIFQAGNEYGWELTEDQAYPLMNLFSEWVAPWECSLDSACCQY